jgi:uncharacterized membrane protein YqhA
MKIFENVLWQSRLVVLLAVFFGMVGSITLFVVASVEIGHVVGEVMHELSAGGNLQGLHSEVVGGIIGAVDLYLIAVVLLIFSFGLYELFISEIEPARKYQASKILEIDSLDQLKTTLAKVIVMVLVVSFFQGVLNTRYSSPLEMIYFSVSILALSLGLYFLHRSEKH